MSNHVARFLHTPSLPRHTDLGGRSHHLPVELAARFVPLATSESTGSLCGCRSPSRPVKTRPLCALPGGGS